MSFCCMRHVPSGASGGRGLKGLIFFLSWKFHETFVTKSLMTGKALIGSIVTGFSKGNSLIRVMHISFGVPFTSAEHEPHFPALLLQSDDLFTDKILLVFANVQIINQFFK